MMLRNIYGDYADTRTAMQKGALKQLIKMLKVLFPNAKVVGHRDFDNGKICPCFNAKTEYS